MWGYGAGSGAWGCGFCGLIVEVFVDVGELCGCGVDCGWGELLRRSGSPAHPLNGTQPSRSSSSSSSHLSAHSPLLTGRAPQQHSAVSAAWDLVPHVPHGVVLAWPTSMYLGQNWANPAVTWIPGTACRGHAPLVLAGSCLHVLHGAEELCQ